MHNRLKEFIGCTILDVCIHENSNQLYIGFYNYKGLIIEDHDYGYSKRYMQTVDDLNSIIDGELIDIVVKRGPTQEGDNFEFKECGFLEIVTSKGSVVINNYIEHSGDYGFFLLHCSICGPYFSLNEETTPEV